MIAPYLTRLSIGYAVRKIDEMSGFYRVVAERRLVFWSFDDVILEPGAPLGE